MSNKIRRNSIIVLILTILILAYLLRKDLPETIRYITQTNIPLLLLAILLFIFSWFFDSLSYYIIIKQYKKKYKLKNALKLNMLTKFFNGITPLASGGQPLQLYCLHKEKIKMNDATSIVIQFFIIYQIALITLSGGCILFTVFNQSHFTIPFVKSLLAIGFLSNFAILLALILVSINKKVNKKIIKTVINFLSKIKIVKNKEEKIKKWDKNCDEFFESSKQIRQNKKTLLAGILLQYLQLIFQYAIPFVLVKAIGEETSLTIIQTIISSSYVFLIGCFVPIPGATGGMEYAFSRCFGNFIIEESIHTVIILWRLITYILPVITGGILFNINVKNKDELEEFQN